MWGREREVFSSFSLFLSLYFVCLPEFPASPTGKPEKQTMSPLLSKAAETASMGCTGYSTPLHITRSMDE